MSPLCVLLVVLVVWVVLAVPIGIIAGRAIETPDDDEDWT